jgi:hypothetical protein
MGGPVILAIAAIAILDGKQQDSVEMAVRGLPGVV